MQTCLEELFRTDSEILETLKVFLSQLDRETGEAQMSLSGETQGMQAAINSEGAQIGTKTERIQIQLLLPNHQRAVISFEHLIKLQKKLKYNSIW